MGTQVFAVLAIGMLCMASCVSGAVERRSGRKLLQETLQGQLLPDVLAAQNAGWQCSGNTCQRSKLSYDDLWLFYKLFYPPPSPPTPPPPEKELVIKRVYGCHDDDDDPTYCGVIDKRIKHAMKEIEYASKTPGVPRVPALKVTSTPVNFEDLKPAPPPYRPPAPKPRPAPQQRPMNNPNQGGGYYPNQQGGPGGYSNEAPYYPQYQQQQQQQQPAMNDPRAAIYPSGGGGGQQQPRPVYLGPPAQGAGNGNVYQPEYQMAAAQQVAANAIPDDFFGLQPDRQSGPAISASGGPAAAPLQNSPMSVTISMTETTPPNPAPLAAAAEPAT